MARKHTKEYILKKCEEALSNGASSFYKDKIVNYAGTVIGNDDLFYSEVIADFIIEHKDEFIGIKNITRKSSYNMNHTGEYNPNTNRIEEKNAIEMFLQSKNGNHMKYIGKVIDYQTPLKDNDEDTAGKIDLLAESDDAVYILELKREDSDETMLRCVLEGYTYLKTINQEKLMKNFGINPSKTLYAAPLVFKGSKQWNEMQGEERKKHPKLLELMQVLDIKGPFYIVTEKRYDIEC